MFHQPHGGLAVVCGDDLKLKFRKLRHIIGFMDFVEI